MKTFAPTAQSAQRSPTAESNERRTAQAAQRQASAAFDHSPLAVAQRERLMSTFGSAAAGPVQMALDEEEPMQGRFEPMQRVEEEEPLQGKLEPAQPARAQPAATSGGGLPAPLQAGIQATAGADLSDVAVHANSAKPAQINALAYAQGADIHLAPGQEQHLPHEAWHVVQQRQGRVKATTQLAGVAVNDSQALETEADVMGARAAAAGQRALSAGGGAGS
jgi:hypothetical protein